MRLADIDDHDVSHAVLVVGRSGSRAQANNAISLGYFARADAVDSIVLGPANSEHNNTIILGNTSYDSFSQNTVVLGDSSTLSWDSAIDGSVSLGSSNYRFSDLVSNTLSVKAESDGVARLNLIADSGQDAGDHWQWSANDGGNFSINHDGSGSQAEQIALTSTGDLTVSGELYLNSDRRLKTEITDLDLPLSKTRQIKAASYQFSHASADGKTHLGLIAQQLEALFPEFVTTAESGKKPLTILR